MSAYEFDEALFTEEVDEDLRSNMRLAKSCKFCKFYLSKREHFKMTYYCGVNTNGVRDDRFKTTPYCMCDNFELKHPEKYMNFLWKKLGKKVDLYGHVINVTSGEALIL